MDFMLKKIPIDKEKTDFRLLMDMSRIYYSARMMDKYKSLAAIIEQKSLKKIEENARDFNNPYYNPYNFLLEIYENLGEYDKGLGIVQKLKVFFPNDPTLEQYVQRFDSLKGGSVKVK